MHLAFTEAFLGATRPGADRSPAERTPTCATGPSPARLVGARNPPSTRAELHEQLEDLRVRGVLRRDERVDDAVRFLRRPPIAGSGIAYRILFAGAVASIPREFRRLLGLRRAWWPAITVTRVRLASAGWVLAVGGAPSARERAIARVARLRRLAWIRDPPHRRHDRALPRRRHHRRGARAARRVGRPPDGHVAVLLDRTACHPVDAALARSAPGSRGLDAGDVAIEVLDCVVGATDGVDAVPRRDIPVRKGTEGWAFVVAHLVDGDAPLTEGDTVTVEVDALYRAALSAGHSACHLASLALNAALAGAWTKEPRLDSLGSPDFDGAANETSTILERGARGHLPDRQVAEEGRVRPVGAG